MNPDNKFLTSTSQSTKIPLMFSLISWWLWKVTNDVLIIFERRNHNYLKIIGYPECLLSVLVILECFHCIFWVLLRILRILPVKVFHAWARVIVNVIVQCCNCKLPSGITGHVGSKSLTSTTLKKCHSMFISVCWELGKLTEQTTKSRFGDTFSSQLVSESEKTQSKPSSEELDVELVSSCCSVITE